VQKKPGEQKRDYRVRIGAQLFDPRDVASRFLERSAAAKQRRAAAAAAAGLPTATAATEARIVQFTQALSAPDVARLRAAYALRLDQYIPNLAFLERLTQQTIDSVMEDFLVRACIALDPALKLAPWIGGGGGQSPDDASLVHDFEATLFDDADPAAAGSALAAVGAHDIQVFDDRDIGGIASVYFVFDEVDHVSQVADIEDVVWIEPVLPIAVTSSAVAVMQSGSTKTSVWDHGLHGEGQVIDVIDDGWPEINHCFFADSAPNQPGPNHRKVVKLRGTNQVLKPKQDALAHATIVCGIAAGDQLNNSGGNPGRGGAWAAKLTCGNLNDLLPIPAPPSNPGRRPVFPSLITELLAGKADGAFIHSCSWISEGHGDYDRNARAVDSFIGQSEEDLVLCASPNSQGPGPFPSTNQSPGTAKNATCVGATTISGTHGSGVAGPAKDGRRKPDLMAVGGSVSSADLTPTNPGNANPENMCGAATYVNPPQTSWATPHAAAAAALVRQYFTEGWYPVGRKVGAPLGFTPTGALLKAVLLNSTIDLTDVPGYPSDLEGWGLIQLDRTLYFDGDVRKLAVWDVRHAVGITPLVDIRRHDLVVLGGAEQLKVTLVWTEPRPASNSSTGQLVNDLDLTVTAPDGTQYVGNDFDFANGVSTPNGSSADSLNNVEMVVVNAPAAGKWLLEVHGVVHQPHLADQQIRHAVAGQGYALVATGALKPPPPLIELFYHLGRQMVWGGRKLATC